MRDRVIGRLTVALLLLGALYLYGWGAGSYALFEPWEPKNAVAIRQMLARHDLITPYLGGNRWTKPILIYWAMAASIWIAGDTELAVRLPSVVAGALGVCMTYYFLRKLRGQRTAVIGACVMGTIPQYFYMARQAMPDMLMTVCIGAAMGFLALGRFGRERKRVHFALFYLFSGLAVLAKGPVALAIISGAVLFYWMVVALDRGDFHPRTVPADLKQILKSYEVPLGALIFTSALFWYVIMLVKYRWAYVEAFLFGENLHRFAEAVRGHTGDVSFYWRTLFHGMYPWIGLLPAALALGLCGHRRLDEEAKQHWFYLSWFLSAFLIISFAGTKLDHYMLPVVPAFVVLVALLWERALRADRPFWMRPALLLSIALVALPIRDFMAPSGGTGLIFEVFTGQDSIENPSVGIFLLCFLAAWSIAMVVAAMKPSFSIAVMTILIAYANGIYFCRFILPQQEDKESLQGYTEYYLSHRGSGAQLFFVGESRRYSIDYYYPDGLYRRFQPDQTEQLLSYITRKDHFYIIVRTPAANSLLKKLRASAAPETWWHVALSSNPRYVLLSNSPQDRVPRVTRRKT